MGVIQTRLKSYPKRATIALYGNKPPFRLGYDMIGSLYPYPTNPPCHMKTDSTGGATESKADLNFYPYEILCYTRERHIPNKDILTYG
jgi:hypothetical protein